MNTLLVAPRPDAKKGRLDFPTLVVAAQSGDDHAWRVLVETLTPLLESVSRKFRLADADRAEAVQDTWTTCLTHLPRLRQPHALPAWLMRICQRHCLAAARRQSRCVPACDDELVQYHRRGAMFSVAEDDPEREVIRAELLELFHEAVSALPERKRRLVRALLEPDVSYEQIASVLGIPVGSIGPTRQRAICDLRRMFVDNGVLAA
jgi:RNA polymerase sigma factor (sigma-70 family)